MLKASVWKNGLTSNYGRNRCQQHQSQVNTPCRLLIEQVDASVALSRGLQPPDLTGAGNDVEPQKRGGTQQRGGRGHSWLAATVPPAHASMAWQSWRRVSLSRKPYCTAENTVARPYCIALQCNCSAVVRPDIVPVPRCSTMLGVGPTSLAFMTCF
jgi:hypothetical protein